MQPVAPPASHLPVAAKAEFSLLKQLDLIVLALALPVFLVAGWPLLGYLAAAGAWLAQRAIQLLASRSAKASLVEGNRQRALGITAFATLGRVWLLALVILLVGKLAEREDGLAAAVLAGVLVTAYFVAEGVGRLLEPEEAK